MLLSLLPEHVLVAGCWHSDLPWSRGVVNLLPELLPTESTRLILHAGDFGIWADRDGKRFLDRLNRALVRHNAVIAFVDGNHEHFNLLYELAGTRNPTQPVKIRSRIFWLPRGYRWTWHGRTWLALGGAASVDRGRRRQNIDWFPDEEINEAQTRKVMNDGRADVMLCHDCPSKVPLRLPPPEWWWRGGDLARSDQHRERLQAIVDVVQPDYLFHGHYHVEYDAMVDMDYGPLVVTGLSKNNEGFANYRVLDVRTMTWKTTEAVTI